MAWCSPVVTNNGGRRVNNSARNTREEEERLVESRLPVAHRSYEDGKVERGWRLGGRRAERGAVNGQGRAFARCRTRLEAEATGTWRAKRAVAGVAGISSRQGGSLDLAGRRVNADERAWRSMAGLLSMVLERSPV